MAKYIGEQLELEALGQYNSSKQASYLCALTKVKTIIYIRETMLTLVLIG
jgi:hypothetical protein